MNVSDRDRTENVPHHDPARPLRGVDDADRVLPDATGGRPVQAWDPPFSGDIDMRIAADGTWFYQKTPVARERLVRLFASILRREADGCYYLVTPVEKCRITVDDAPFIAVAMEVEGAGRAQRLAFTTNVGDRVSVDGDHPFRFAAGPDADGVKPYILVRDRLEALVARAVYYDLVELGTVEDTADGRWFGLWSAGSFFPMTPAEDLAQ